MILQNEKEGYTLCPRIYKLVIKEYISTWEPRQFSVELTMEFVI